LAEAGLAQARVTTVETELDDVRGRLDAVKRSLLQRDEAIDVLRARIAALEAELAAIKGRRCETCIDYQADRGYCGRYLSPRDPWSFCEHWEGKKDADA